jgi:hypothetical protein
VLDTGYKQSLRQVAPIVDRELWGIGFTCRKYGVSFKSYKLISDYGEENIKSDEIKSNALYYSKHLFDFYKKLSLTKESW